MERRTQLGADASFLFGVVPPCMGNASRDGQDFARPQSSLRALDFKAQGARDPLDTLLLKRVGVLHPARYRAAGADAIFEHQ